MNIPITEIDSPVPGSKAYAMGECRIIVSRDIHGGMDSIATIRWHLSISCARRLPTWEELRDARYALIPDDVSMAMILPPKAQYVNIHEFCFHLYEVIE